nr:hypothetical protein [Arthrobacter sp. KBS0703]
MAGQGRHRILEEPDGGRPVERDHQHIGVVRFPVSRNQPSARRPGRGVGTGAGHQLHAAPGEDPPRGRQPACACRPSSRATAEPALAAVPSPPEPCLLYTSRCV